MDYDRNDALLHWIFRQTQGDAWFRPNEENISSGVALRVNDGTQEFRIFPYETPSLEPFEAAVSALNPLVAVKVRSAAVHAALAEVSPEDRSIYVDSQTQIQILDTILLLPHADREQSAAFIRDERTLIIWSESLDRIVPLCQDIDDRLIKLLWRSRPNHLASLSNTNSNSASHSATGSVDHSTADGSGLAFNLPKYPSRNHIILNSRPESLRLVGGVLKGPFGEQGRDLDEKQSDKVSDQNSSQTHKRSWFFKKVPVPSLEHGQFHLQDDDDEHKSPRPVPLYAPLYNGLAAGLAFVFVGNGIKTLIVQWRLDGDLSRFGLVVLLPLLYCVSLFFCIQIVQNLSMMVGPIAQYHSNSKYFSSVPPLPSPSIDTSLPHITIQMPVYKESLQAVLAPSIVSLKNAMQTYARQGGTSSIFVCDDGLRVIGRKARDERLAFYASHNVGWVARPKDEGSKEGGFRRRGRFKKASNLNYGLELSLRMEKHLERLLIEQKEKDPGINNPRTSTSSSSSGNGNGNNNTQSHSVGPGLGVNPTSPLHSPIPLPLSHKQIGATNADATQYGIQYQNREGDDTISVTAGSWGQPNSNITFGGAGAGPFVAASQVPTSPLAHSHTNTESVRTETPPLLPPSPLPLYDPAFDLEEKALNLAIEDVFLSFSSAPSPSHRPWAANGRSIRIGELLLLVDSDTVVPEDCLRDAAREMAKSPQVAIIQHESGVMSVAGHYFENGISYFTRRVNRCIGISCANGEVAPFMGHNAFLRWKALQDAAFVDPEDGKRKIWSESNVSEDFDMALRLILKGYIVRWATYSKGGFKEGVSLSVDDEINRWQKYSFGCNELLFNPLIRWFRKGPITKQIHIFLWSRAPLHYKLSMMAYMFSYYGIAASITISLINYVLLGFQFPVDGYFMHSFEIFLATTVVFWWSGTAGYTLLEYRLGYKKLLDALLENVIWIPFFFFFFGGLSIPISQALLAHLFSYNITWSATVKEVERSNFFKEIPKIAKRFWFPMGISLLIVIGMVVCSMKFVPIEWRVDGSAWAVILPLSIATACHILFPIVLNPWLMVFSY